MPTHGRAALDAGLREAGPAYDEAWHNVATLAWLRRVDLPVAPPGRAETYANLGYICLAIALERAAGRPIADLVRDRLLVPAAMPSSRLASDPPPLAAAALRGRPAPPRTLGDGGLWTTARDLAAWNRACSARRFGERAHALAEAPGRLDDGTPVPSGWGVGLRTVGGRTAISHGGWVSGFTSKLVRQPDTGAHVVVVTSSTTPRACTRSRTRFPAGSSPPEPAPQRRPAATPAVARGAAVHPPAPGRPGTSYRSAATASGRVCSP